MHSLPNLRVCPFNSARVTFIAFPPRSYSLIMIRDV